MIYWQFIIQIKWCTVGGMNELSVLKVFQSYQADGKGGANEKLYAMETRLYHGCKGFRLQRSIEYIDSWPGIAEL